MLRCLAAGAEKGDCGARMTIIMVGLKQERGQGQGSRRVVCLYGEQGQASRDQNNKQTTGNK